MSTPIPPVVPPPKPYTFKKASEIEIGDSIRTLIFSQPKAGKTTLAATFPGASIADFDGDGVKVVKSKYFQEKYPKKDEDIIYESFVNPVDRYGLPTSTDAFWNAIEWVNRVIADPNRKTIVIDTLSSMSKVASHAAIKVSGTRKRSNTWQNAATDHMMLLTMQDFGAEMSAVEQFLDQLMNVKGKHILVLAHERQETSDSGAVISRAPLITGDRLRAAIPRWFDDVWYLDTDMQGKRTLRCQPFGNLKGVGSRLGLPATIEDPNYDKIITALKGGK